MTRLPANSPDDAVHNPRACTLAVLTPDLGMASETFVRRHCNDLLPGRTAAIARTQQAAWKVNGPTLLTDGLRRPAPSRLARWGGWLGLSRAVPPDREAYVRDQTQRFLRDHGVRVLLGEYLHWSVDQLALARRVGLPLWAHGHGYDVSAHLRNPRFRAAYRDFAYAAGVIVVSDFSRLRLVELGLPAHKIHVIPCGADVRGEPLKREPTEVVRCLAVGRMVAKKGPILLLDAFRRAAEAMPNLRLDLVGGGELFVAAEQFVRAFGLANRVTLHGEQPAERVKELLEGGDVFLHHAIVDPRTGDEEGMPVAILEAMAAALPVVSTRHAGIPEAVVDNQTGFLCDEGDTAGMAEAIMLLARDPALRSELGAAGWSRARERFSWARERRDLLQLMDLRETDANNARPTDDDLRSA